MFLWRWFPAPMALSACLLIVGCANGPAAATGGSQAVLTATQDEVLGAMARPAERPVRIAALALTDRALGKIRGGFETPSGVMVNFAFQQATYINHQLVQTIVLPTLTVANGMASVTESPVVTSVPIGNAPSAPVTATPNLATNTAATVNISGMAAQVSSVPAVIQSITNSGLTSVASTLSSGGLTSLITNRADGAFIQQATTVDIGVTGLSQMLQQSTAAQVMNRVAPGNALFH